MGKPELVYSLIAFLVCMLLAWMFSYIVRHRERIKMIENGINPDENITNSHRPVVSIGMKIGIVIIGLSIGLGIIGILVSISALGQSNAFPLSILGLCTGSSLIIANRIKST